MEKYLCECKKCAIVGGKMLSGRTKKRHIEVNGQGGQSSFPSEERVAYSCSTSHEQPSISSKAETQINIGKIHKILNDVSDVRNQPLFEGSRFSVLHGTTMLLNIYGLFPTVSQRAMDELFRVLNEFILPEPNKLPNSYRSARKLVEDFLTPVEVVDVCTNDHMAFRGENGDLDHCRVCNSNRYEVNKQGVTVAAKSFVYLPVIPRLTRWFEFKMLARQLQSHPPPSSEFIEDIYDSPSWERLYHPDGPYNGDKRCLTFAISADGMDPYQRGGTSYSMCPIILRCFNLPSGERNKFGHMVLTTIIPGPSVPGDLNPYMEPLVDELLKLNDGVPCMDSSRDGEMFQLSARVVMGIFDTPGLAKFTKNASTNAKINACGHCHIKGIYCAPYKKVVYARNRRYLPPSSEMRQRKVFHGGKIEKKGEPKWKKRAKMCRIGQKIAEYTALAALPESQTEGEPNEFEDEVQRLQAKHGKFGLEEMSRLPYYSEFSTPVDLMHCIQGIAKKFFRIFTGHSNQNAKTVVTAEHALKRFMDVPGPTTPWHLQLHQKRQADQRLLSVRVVSGFNWKPKKLFENTPAMKSVEWLKVFGHGIITYSMRGMLGNDQMETFVEFCSVVSMLTDYRLIRADLKGLTAKVSEVLCKVERDFPISIQTLVTHMLHHAPYYLETYGPAYIHWMFGFERFNSFLKSRILNRKSPEVTAIESYRMYEFCQAMVLARLIPESAAASTSNSLEEAAEADTDSRLLLGRRLHLDRIDLSQSEIDALHEIGIEVDAPPVKYFEATNKIGRLHGYSCFESERAHGYSSYVAFRDQSQPGSVIICRVLHFLKLSTRSGEDQEVAKLHKYRTTKEKHGLYSIEDGEPKSNTCYVRCSDLSPPLISAVDTEQQSKIWLLDVQSSYLAKIPS